MKLNLSKSFFLSFMIIGVLISLCSNNWLFIWVGLELSLISFLPMMSSKMIISSESSMKYFLVQSISSAILILGLMGMISNKFNYDMVILLSLLIKMGVAPFHLWLLGVVEGLKMIPMMLMFTLSKITPLMMLTLINLSLVMIISITLICGSLLGLNQSSTRKIITYSSIFNMGLILMSIKNNFIWLYYLFIYSTLVIMLIMILYKMNMFYVNQMIMNEKFPINKLMLWTTLLSMGGMPPFLGFSIKLIIIEFAINNIMIINLVILIMFSLLVMFFYLRMTYLAIMFFSMNSKWSMLKINKLSWMFIVINLFSLPLVLTIKIFY
uniref:NADH dehydrogenase subunit 2 n=1 Tax=Kusala populi TaxID=2950938 RepID=UPI00207A56AB|nr:NADH dehydrogenase subunit 2 [Kusala populi]URW11942.1 NADH dehydrogenase subunit 2 [Kusala populi]